MGAVRTLASGFYTGCSRLKTALAAAVVLIYIMLVIYGGGRLWEMVVFWVAAVMYIVLPGFLAAKLLNTKKFLPGFSAPLAIILGSGFLAVLYCFCMYLGLLPILYVLPPVLSFVFVGMAYKDLLRRPRKSFFKLPTLTPQQWMMVMLFCALLLVYTFAQPVKNALPMQVGDTLLNHDLLWNAGNANSFKLAFPPIDIRYFDVRLSYHYFTEMIAGVLSLVSGADAYRILAFYLQPLVLGAMLLCLWRFAKVLWPSSAVKQLLFPYAMFLFSCASLWKILPDGRSVFWNQNITHLVTNINSQASAVLVLSVFLGLFVTAARVRYRIGFVHFALTTCTFALLCVTKGPMAAIVAAALVVCFVVGLFLGKTGLRGVLLSVALLATFAVFYFMLFSSGANSSTTFNLTETLNRGYFTNILALLESSGGLVWAVGVGVLYVAQTVLMMPAQIVLFLRGVFYDLRHFKHIPAERLLFYAAGVGGTLAYLVVNHPHLSQMYFLYVGIYFMTILAVDNIDFLCAKKAVGGGVPTSECVAGDKGEGAGPQKASAVQSEAFAAALGEENSCSTAQSPKEANLKLPLTQNSPADVTISKEAPRVPFKRRWMRRVFIAVVACFAAVGMITSAFLYINLLGSGARRLATNLGILEKYPYDTVMTADEEAGMIWLAQNTPPDMMFATNRIHTGANAEGISNLYSGLSGRQGFMEGFQYAVTNMGVPQQSVDERRIANDLLFSEDSFPELVIILCRQWGITHIVYSTQFDGGESQLSSLTKVFDSPTLRIYEVPQ